MGAWCRRSVGTRAGTAGIEFAAAISVVLILVGASVDGYRLLTAQRALDLGVESALRYAAMNSGTATAGTIAQVVTGNAQLLLGSAGRSVAVTVTASPRFAPGSTVRVSARYAWAPIMLPADFISVALGSRGSITVRN